MCVVYCGLLGHGAYALPMMGQSHYTNNMATGSHYQMNTKY